MSLTASAVPSADSPLAERPPTITREEPWVRRRIQLIWGLLLVNGMPWLGGSLLPVPQRLTQLITAGALALALLLTFTLNHRLLFRRNLVLALATVLAVTSLTTSIRGTAGAGAVFRSVRLISFLAVLWLLTPWWGRRDLLLARCHLRALLAVCATIVAGIVVAPGPALGGPGGRLSGVLWPIPPPQVAEYAAVVAGMAMVLWLSGRMGRRQALLVGGGGVGLILLTQTRTALLALTAGVICAAFSLLVTRRRVRRLLAVSLVMAPMVVVLLAPAFSNWFTRDQTSEQLGGLTGRKDVWGQLLDAPRPTFNRWFGAGLSDKSFEGRSIDSTWLAVYQDQGLVGDALVGGIFLVLLVTSALRPPSPARALAIFLAIYCAAASYTEVGFGDASPYLLHIALAASLLTQEAEAMDDQNLTSARPQGAQ